MLVPRVDAAYAADYFAYFRRDDGAWVGPVRLDAVSSPAGSRGEVTSSTIRTARRAGGWSAGGGAAPVGMA